MSAINPIFRENGGQLSAPEFQQMLYTWFEEKGLIADLRSHLRSLMIRKLRNTPVGKVSKTLSLSKQAFSLVIAEHLLREGCYYTLSIFSTEVPGITNQLPFSLYETTKQNQSWRFDQESVVNILELIGITKNSKESLRVLALYYQNVSSLLGCLISSKTVESTETVPDQPDLPSYISNILVNLGVPTSLIDEVKGKIDLHTATVGRTIKQQQENKFTGVIDELKAELLAKDQQIQALMGAQAEQKTKKKYLRAELRSSQQKLSQMALYEQALKMKEMKLGEKMAEVSELGSFLKKLEEKTCVLKHCDEKCELLVSVNQQLEEGMRRKELGEKEKKVEFERMSGEYSALVKELNSARVKVDFLNLCLLKSSQLNAQPDAEKAESSDESENITGEVVKQVRGRLEELERESQRLEHKFQNLKVKAKH